MQLPSQTVVILRAKVGDKATDYVSYALGPSRWGIRLSIPMILNQAFTLPTGTQVHISFVLNNKFMEFQSYVMGYEQTVPPSMVIAEPTIVAEGNRRRYFRLKKELPISYIAEVPQVMAERTNTADLSLGGLSMVTRVVFGRGTHMTMNLDLPEQTMVLTGTVAWSGFKGKLALTGVEFTKVSESNLKVLSKYLQGLEREVRA